MNKDELKKSFLKSLGQELSPKGYQTFVTDQTLVKKLPEAHHMIHAGFIVHPQDINVTVDVGIRLPNVEKFVDEIQNERSSRFSFTIGVDVGHLTVGKRLRWTLVNETDIPQAVENIRSVLTQVDTLFFDRFPTSQSIFEMLSRNDSTTELLSPLALKRAIRTIVLAYLLNGREALDEAIQSKTIYMTSKGGPQISDFNEFCEKMMAKVSGTQ